VLRLEINSLENRVRIEEFGKTRKKKVSILIKKKYPASEFRVYFEVW
jgi:hypothetical protein